jgi:hypothetical protein
MALLSHQGYAGPQVIGMIDTRQDASGFFFNDIDTITGLGNCPTLNNGQGPPNNTAPGVGSTADNPDTAVPSKAINAHGTNHSVAADPVNNQVYVPISSTSFQTGMTGICAQGGGVDANGCIAVFTRSSPRHERVGWVRLAYRIAHFGDPMSETHQPRRDLTNCDMTVSAATTTVGTNRDLLSQ